MPRAVATRIASSSDAPALAVLAERTFRSAFEANNAPEDIEAYVRGAFSRDRIASELADSASTFLVSVLEGERKLVGYAKLRTGTTDPSVTGPRPVELERLYVEPSAIGSGIGAALMQAVMDHAEAEGHQTLWLGVWEKNERALVFYERWGFETVGDHVFRLGSDDQTDLILERPVRR